MKFLRGGGYAEGFQPGGKGTAFDWKVDATQRRVLQGMQKRWRAAGVKGFVQAQSNSPPYWMTKSGSVTGSKDCGKGTPNVTETCTNLREVRPLCLR